MTGREANTTWIQRLLRIREPDLSTSRCPHIAIIQAAGRPGPEPLGDFIITTHDTTRNSTGGPSSAWPCDASREGLRNMSMYCNKANAWGFVPPCDTPVRGRPVDCEFSYFLELSHLSIVQYCDKFTPNSHKKRRTSQIHTYTHIYNHSTRYVRRKASICHAIWRMEYCTYDTLIATRVENVICGDGVEVPYTVVPGSWVYRCHGLTTMKPIPTLRPRQQVCKTFPLASSLGDPHTPQAHELQAITQRGVYWPMPYGPPSANRNR